MEPRKTVEYNVTNKEIIQSEEMEMLQDNGEFRLVLLGKTGSGKSSTGNMICGQDVFGSRVSESSVTKTCQYVETSRFGQTLSIVDTPGSFDTTVSNDVIMTEVARCLALSAPGPHVFIYVFNALSRFTKEEEDSIKQFVDHFGERVFDYMMVVFTRYDDLVRCTTSASKYISNVSTNFKTFLSNCKWRLCWFDNTLNDSSAGTQVRTLLSEVEKMIKENGNISYFTNTLYTEAEKLMKKREEEIMLDQRKKKNELSVLRIREERIEKDRKLKTWRMRDIERRLSELESQPKAAGDCVPKKSRLPSHRASLSQRPSLEREVDFLHKELKKIKLTDLTLIEKQHEEIKKLTERLSKGYHRGNPRSMARKEVSRRNSSFSQMVSRGIIALGKHLLTGLLGLLLL